MTKSHTLPLPFPTQTILCISWSEPSMLLMLCIQNWRSLGFGPTSCLGNDNPGRQLPCDSEAQVSHFPLPRNCPGTCASQVEGCHSKPLICDPLESLTIWCFGGWAHGKFDENYGFFAQEKKKKSTNKFFHSIPEEFSDPLKPRMKSPFRSEKGKLGFWGPVLLSELPFPEAFLSFRPCLNTEVGRAWALISDIQDWDSTHSFSE